MSPSEQRVSVAEAFGQVVWLLSQSPVYRRLAVQDVEAAFLPPIVAGQVRIFRLGEGALANLGADRDGLPNSAGLEKTPLAVAVWARVSAEGEARLQAGEALRPDDWTGGQRLWLVELVSPFSSAAAGVDELLIADLMQGPFRGQTVNLHSTDPHTGERQHRTFGGPLAVDSDQA